MSRLAPFPTVLPENPFLALELRRLRGPALRMRMALPAAAVVVVPSLGLALLAALLGLRVLPPELLRMGSLTEVLRGVFTAFLAALGIAAGLHAGRRVIMAERQAGMLEALRLLPLGPLPWLAQKLVYPLLLLGLAAGMMLPPLVSAGILGALPAQEAPALLLIPLAAGSATLLVMLLLDPGGDEASGPAGPAVLTPGEKQARARRLGVTAPLLLALGLAAAIALLARGGWWAPLPPHLGGAPRWTALAVLAGALLVNSLLAAAAELSGTDRLRRAAQCAGWTGVAGGLLLSMALLWGTRGWWWLAPALVLTLAAIAAWGVVRGPRVARRVDPAAEAELRWLADRWENALFVRDLRAHTRARSLRSACGLSAVAAVAVLAFLAAWWITGGFGARLGGLTAQIFLQLTIQPLAHLSARARALWLQDHQAGRLQLLLLSPTGSSELLLGRAAASALYQLAGTWGMLLVVPGGLAWLAAAGFPWVIPPVLSLIFLLAASPVTASGPAPLHVTAREHRRAHRRRGRCLGWLHAGCGVLAVAAVFAGLAARLMNWLGPVAAVTAAVVLLLLWPLTRAWLRFRVQELDWLRQGEAEVVSVLPAARRRPRDG